MDRYGHIRHHVADLFYEKCANNRLRKDEIKLRADGTTNLKLAALPIMMEIQKVTKIEGDYNHRRPYLIADKLIGNVNFCLGLLQAEGKIYYVPASTLLEDIKKLTDSPSQVLAILSKGKGEEKYSTVRHVTKGLDFQKLCLPMSISRTISAELFRE